MSDEQTIYVSPDDDLTTVRERLEQIPSRKITLVIPSQTQLRSHVAWKLLYARARELTKEVLIVSSDPQVRSVAHAVKFKVAHSLESISHSGRPRSGSRSGTGRSNAGTSRSSRPSTPSSTTTTHTTKPKESTGKRSASRSPLSGRTSTWPEAGSFTQPEPLDSLPSQLDEPRPQRLKLPERNGTREERGHLSNQIYDIQPEGFSAIHPLPINQIEEPDLLIEDYNQAQDILQAATGSLPVVQPTAPKDADAESPIPPYGNVDTYTPEAGASPKPTSQSYRSHPQVYGDDAPFIYMQDDSPPPAQPEQRGQTILHDDGLPLEYPLLPTSAISDLPTNVLKDQVGQRDDDEDDIVPPIAPHPITPARAQDVEFAARQTVNEEEDQLPALPQSPAPMQVPQAISLPAPQSKPSVPTSRPLSPRAGRKTPQQAPAQKQSVSPPMRSGSRVSQPAASRRSAPPPIQQHKGPAGPKGTPAISTRRPPATGRPARTPRRLYLILASIVAIFVIFFGALYLNTASTVQFTVTTQDYIHPVTLTLSNQNQSGTVHATNQQKDFTQSGSGTATGTTMQGTNRATGTVNFTNTGDTSVQIPSQTSIATANNIRFVTTATVLIPPAQTASAVPLPVPIQASNEGASGNVLAGTITSIPTESLASIAQAQSPPVAPENLKLKVSNPEATTGGEAHEVPSTTQGDLDNVKKDLHEQLADSIKTWVQEQAQNGLAGQPVMTDTLTDVGQPEPNKAFSATLKVTVTILAARFADAQKIATNQLKNALQADKQFGPTFTIIGESRIDPTPQNGSSGNTLIVNATGQAGPNLNTPDLLNSIKGKSLNEVEAILHQKSPAIKTVDVQTQPGIFTWVSPWADHIKVTVAPAARK